MGTMRALLQRVSSARVTVDGRTISEIDRGLLVFLCALKGDEDGDLDYIAKKTANLRIFEDDEGTMNRSIADVGGSALVVSQFTLAAATRKGNRPSFDNAEAPEKAKAMYEAFVRRLEDMKIPVRTGMFGAMMAVSLVNDGPVTVWFDSRER